MSLPAMSRRITAAAGDISALYPDNRENKDVFLQASGPSARSDPTLPRHVLIYWVNATLPNGDQIYDTTQLEKHGNYFQYHYPNVVKVDHAEKGLNQTFFLGKFTSQQREDILDLASEVEFQPTSLTEGSRVWTRKLLAKMEGEGLIGRELYAQILQEVPLPSAVIGSFADVSAGAL
ncbi:hypothetical protein BJ138DRAFT_1147316 [Hygrophoropsis aurantiaca]|uniref:Uncharacterized protein n=1 Tax=Hygrophoropsis aurantiaca TaxID=72124 RepID=A0ACB8AHN4_9AGAM|nr:hypothetical protein BJ138DRAFT_1147316 [Hygrophoropsis aurantiaca]